MDKRVIFGPPGTGKTKTLVDYAAKEAASRKVLFLSYTRAAAAEATSRVKGNIHVSTLHALAFARLNLTRQMTVDRAKIRSFSAATGIPFQDKDDEGEQEGDEYKQVYSYSCNRIMPVSDAYDHFGRPGTPSKFEYFVKSYEDWKRQYGYMDFDDMLVGLSKAKSSQGHYSVVMLDEAQDCSPLQWAAFENVIKGGTQRVYVAGDDDQAIFEWNGADPHGMIKFAGDAQTRVLEQSYRVPITVHAMAHSKALANIKQRVGKKFEPRPADGAVQLHGGMEDFDWRTLDGQDALVLARTRQQLTELQRFMNDAQVPYSIINGYSPWENRYAKAIRGCLMGKPNGQEERDAMQHFGLKPGDDWKRVLPAHLVDWYGQIATRLYDPLTVRLSTVHGAKGMEADRVIVDLTMPPRVQQQLYADRDAELRVLYVSLTRAKNTLYLLGENPLL